QHVVHNCRACRATDGSGASPREEHPDRCATCSNESAACRETPESGLKWPHSRSAQGEASAPGSKRTAGAKLLERPGGRTAQGEGSAQATAPRGGATRPKGPAGRRAQLDRADRNAAKSERKAAKVEQKTAKQQAKAAANGEPGRIPPGNAKRVIKVLRIVGP